MILNGAVADGLDMRLGDDDKKNAIVPSAHSESKDDECPLEPIAIIGMACRLPGGCSSTSTLWDHLIEGRSGHCNIPESRFNAKGFYHAGTDRPGSIHHTGGYFIEEDVRLFENSFFGINNLEAKYMDPQQRQLLEVVYECFESAGLPLHEISGSNTGCYVANFTNDYMVMQSKDPENFHHYSATGFGSTILANRLSHVFNLCGPSLVLDTACSSSLYSLHVACTALHAKECDTAVVAGANLIQSPELQIAAVKAGILSPTSTCHTFDASADGYGRADGVGALLVKRLSDAIKDEDPIRSVIRGTAVNSNGKTNGITLPSVDGQESVIRKAYAMAGLLTDETEYVEAHGTGTSVGDPIEIEALSRVFHHKLGYKTLVGSVKTNLGHSEAVSGITSVIKTTLALEKGLIPPTIGIQEINPNLKLDERNVEIVTSPTPWPETRVPRASINSFGYGGANAHAIIEAASSHVPKSRDTDLIRTKSSRTTLLLPFSAHSISSLKGGVEDLALLHLDITRLVDLAFTLAHRRSKLSTRGFILAHYTNLDNDLSASKLRVLDSGNHSSKLPIAFVFTGQGAQWPNMGRQLMTEFPTYACAIDELDVILAQLSERPSWTIHDMIIESDEVNNIHQASRSQTVCTATQIALVELLKEWGVTAEVVVGHSSGEIAAAYAAGHISAAQAITIAYYRGMAVSKSSLDGAMMATSLDGNSASEAISKLGLHDTLRIACFNSPESTTLSGDSEAVDQLLKSLQQQQKSARRLNTGGKAYHSHHMTLIAEEYEGSLSETLPKNRPQSEMPSSIRFMSSMTRQFTGSEMTSGPAYWRRNLESPVCFHDALREILKERQYQFIELGPHPILQLPVNQIWKELYPTESHLQYLPTILRGKDAVDSMLNLIGNLYLYGHEVNFQMINHLPEPPITSPSLRVKCKVLHNLPKYSWRHDVHLWSESRLSSEFRERRHPRHDLLGSISPGGSGENFSWRNILRISNLPWLADHRMGQKIVFAGACYLAMAIEALSQIYVTNQSDSLQLTFQDFRFISTLEIPDDDDGVELFTRLRPCRISSIASSNKWWELEISSFHQQAAVVHSRGLIGYEYTLPRTLPGDPLQSNGGKVRSPRSWYDQMGKDGFIFGPSFQSLTEILRSGTDKERQIISKIEINSSIEDSVNQESEYLVHPIMLDAILQTALIATSNGAISDIRTKVPISIRHAQIMIKGRNTLRGTYSARATSTSIGFGKAKANVELADLEGNILAHVDEVKFVPYHGFAESHKDLGNRYPMLRVIWKPDVSRLNTSANPVFAEYVDNFVASVEIDYGERNYGRLAGALDLLVHQRANIRILELGKQEDTLTSYFLTMLDADTSMKRFRSYTQATMSKEGQLVGRTINSLSELSDGLKKTRILSETEAFDVVIFLLSPPDIENQIEKLDGNVTLSAKFLFQGTLSEMPLLDPERYRIFPIQSKESEDLTIITRMTETLPELTGISEKVVLVSRNDECSFTRRLQTGLTRHLNNSVIPISLDEVCAAEIPAKSIVLSTIELNEAVLSSLRASELASIQKLTSQASTLLWITGGGLYSAKAPASSLVLGLSRAVSLEQPSLNFVVFDLDESYDELDSTLSNVLFILKQALSGPDREYEYLQRKGVLHTSRFIPEKSMNETFQKQQKRAAESKRLSKADNFQIFITKHGQVESADFVQCVKDRNLLPSGYLEVQVMSFGLNEKDLHVLTGKTETKDTNCSSEFSGIVTRCGDDVLSFNPGDRIVVMAPNPLAAYLQVPEWACCKLREDEDFMTLSTIPLAFSTALYALHHRAKMQQNESVLVHSAAGGVGIAAIQVAQLMDAEIFATVSTEEKKQYLVKNFGLNINHIFNSRDSSFLPEVLAATSGRGVDIVLNSLTNDLLHDSWRACAEFGRFIEIGKRNITDGGKLDLSIFERNATFTAFDLSSLYYSDNKVHRDIWIGLLRESIELYRSGRIKSAPPPRSFGVSDITGAFRHLSSSDCIGEVAVSLENPESRIQVVPRKYSTTFDPAKTYLLVGCLGGLGRSLSKWMLGQGARKFVFLSRTGVDKPAAKSLVEDLEAAGVHVIVSRASVTEFSDVVGAIAQIQGSIGGVVHAAMGLDEALFSDMSCKSWHISIGPKVKGTWNLHNALKDRQAELDFFFMTSSISGSVGTATESNYCAANTFMDAFARYRRSLGLPALSLGLGMISEVGYLHEHPEIEKLLLRKGIHPINEEELLLMCDIALTNASNYGSIKCSDQFAEAHILTGLEVLGLQQIRRQGFEGGSHVLDDPRATIIAEALRVADGNKDETQTPGKGQSLPDAVATALTESVSEKAVQSSLLDAVQAVVADKIGNLLLLPPESLNPGTRLSEFGMDSMLAAEFRQFMFHTFDVDVPFSTLLGDNTSVAEVTEMVAEGVLASRLEDGA